MTFITLRYDNGDQREGFFRDNILDGQVIFTKSDGTTLIENWVEGEKVETEKEELDLEEESLEKTVSSAGRNEISSGEEGGSIVGRGGARSGSWADVLTTVTLSLSLHGLQVCEQWFFLHCVLRYILAPEHTPKNIATTTKKNISSTNMGAHFWWWVLN